MCFSCSLSWISSPSFGIKSYSFKKKKIPVIVTLIMSDFSSYAERHTHTQTHSLTSAQPCRKSNVGGRQSNETSVIMLALIPVAMGRVGGGLIQTHASTLSQARGSAFTISISARSEIQEGGRESWGEKKKKQLLVYLRRWDETTSAALKWALDRYRPSSSPNPSLRNWGSVRHFAYRLQWVLGLGQAQQQAICWLLFWQNCQGLSSIKWWIELSGSKEASRASSACVYFFLFFSVKRMTQGNLGKLITGEVLKSSSVGVWQNIMRQTNKPKKEKSAIQFGSKSLLITCPYVFSNI